MRVSHSTTSRRSGSHPIRPMRCARVTGSARSSWAHRRPDISDFPFVSLVSPFIARPSFAQPLIGRVRKMDALFGRRVEPGWWIWIAAVVWSCAAGDANADPTLAPSAFGYEARAFIALNPGAVNLAGDLFYRHRLYRSDKPLLKQN